MNITNKGQLTYLDISEVGITDGLVGYWKLNGDTRDYSGNENDGIVSGSTITSGLKNLSYNFNGITNYILVDLIIDITQPYTIMCWAKPNVLLGSGTSSVRKTPYTGPGPTWNPGLWVTQSFIRVHSDTQFRDATISWTDLSWHMIGQTFDGVNTYAIFDDQILSGTSSTYGPSNPTQLLFGSEIITGNSYNWDGKITDFRIYSKVLSIEEVITQYKFGLTTTTMQLSSEGILYINNKLIEGL